jgi:hypothetical protein
MVAAPLFSFSLRVLPEATVSKRGRAWLGELAVLSLGISYSENHWPQFCSRTVASRSLADAYSCRRRGDDDEASLLVQYRTHRSYDSDVFRRRRRNRTTTAVVVLPFVAQLMLNIDRIYIFPASIIKSLNNNIQVMLNETGSHIDEYANILLMPW